jgi:TPR repeat protein
MNRMAPIAEYEHQLDHGSREDWHKGRWKVDRRAAEFDVAGLNHPIETYLKAAEDGFIAAQYLVGLAHLQGVGVEKNGSAAYYWLRMVEENCRKGSNGYNPAVGLGTLDVANFAKFLADDL